MEGQLKSDSDLVVESINATETRRHRRPSVFLLLAACVPSPTACADATAVAQGFGRRRPALLRRSYAKAQQASVVKSPNEASHK
jgi:hypothetical protein